VNGGENYIMQNFIPCLERLHGERYDGRVWGNQELHTNVLFGYFLKEGIWETKK
jgi:hypothetical protein